MKKGLYIIILYKENNGKSFISKELMSSALKESVKDFGWYSLLNSVDNSIDDSKSKYIFSVEK